MRSDDEWQTLCDVLGQPELTTDKRFATLAERLAHQDELNDIVGEWTKNRNDSDVEGLLQAHGIPAHVVQNSDELFTDPQLQHRGHLVEVAHAIHGTTTVEGSRFRLSRTPAKIEHGAPTFGQHSQHILGTILGYDTDRIAELAAAGALD